MKGILKRNVKEDKLEDSRINKRNVDEYELIKCSLYTL